MKMSNKTGRNYKDQVNSTTFFSKQINWRMRWWMILQSEVQEHSCFEEALNNSKWKETLEEEITMIRKSKTWEFADKPKDKKIMGLGV